MVIPISDSSPDPDLKSHRANGDSGAGPGTRERIDPDDVRADWFSAGPEEDALFDKLTETYEAQKTPFSDDLAAIAVDVVQWYLRDYATAVEPADVAGLVDPRAALADWFSAGTDPTSEPFGMLAVAFETGAHEDSTSDELAGIAVDAVQRYLRDCAAETDG